MGLRDGAADHIDDSAFYFPDLAICDPAIIFGVDMPCSRYGLEHAHFVKAVENSKFRPPRKVRLPDGRAVYVASKQWFCAECARERETAHKTYDAAVVAGAANTEELKMTWKRTFCTFKAYNQGVMDAFLLNPLTAFIPLDVYPYYITHTSAVMNSTVVRITR